jgi:hypothetical protein
VVTDNANAQAEKKTDVSVYLQFGEFCSESHWP